MDLIQKKETQFSGMLKLFKWNIKEKSKQKLQYSLVKLFLYSLLLMIYVYVYESLLRLKVFYWMTSIWYNITDIVFKPLVKSS